METDAVIGAREQLARLCSELSERGWEAEIRGLEERPVLRVANPHDDDLNGAVVVENGRYRWTWGPILGPVEDVPQTADRIVYVLRGVTP